MSNLPTPVVRAEKTMSSRLLTMKFMQRAAASSPPSISHEGPRSAKRRKTSADEASVTSPIPTHITDAQAFQAAADAKDAKRAAAIERVAAEAGETRWVLSSVDTNRSQADRTDSAQSSGRRVEIGRKSFGRFDEMIEVRSRTENVEKQLHGGETSDTSSSSSGSGRQHGSTYSEDKEKNDTGTDCTNVLRQQTYRDEALQRAKADTKARKDEKAEAARLAEHRRSKDPKSNRESFISVGGGARGVAGIGCGFCGQEGHREADCSRKAKLKRRMGDK
ncbi:MAG: hypothetical protein Q9207_000873 [Kuettlingeria erythrocarpa]